MYADFGENYKLEVLHADRITCMFMKISRSQCEGCMRVKPLIYN